MEITQRWLILLTVVATVAMGACHLERDAAARFFEDAQKVTYYLRVLQLGYGHQTKLKSDHAQVVAVIKQKEELARDVLDNRLSLQEAAKRFAATDFGVQYDWDYLKTTHPEMTFETRCSYYVVDTIEYLKHSKNTSDSAKATKFLAIAQCWLGQ
jgi:hypothetical protein